MLLACILVCAAAVTGCRTRDVTDQSVFNSSRYQGVAIASEVNETLRIFLSNAQAVEQSNVATAQSLTPQRPLKVGDTLNIIRHQSQRAAIQDTATTETRQEARHTSTPSAKRGRANFDHWLLLVALALAVFVFLQIRSDIRRRSSF